MEFILRVFGVGFAPPEVKNSKADPIAAALHKEVSGFGNAGWRGPGFRIRSGGAGCGMEVRRKKI